MTDEVSIVGQGVYLVARGNFFGALAMRVDHGNQFEHFAAARIFGRGKLPR